MEGDAQPGPRWSRSRWSRRTPWTGRSWTGRSRRPGRSWRRPDRSPSVTSRNRRSEIKIHAAFLIAKGGPLGKGEKVEQAQIDKRDHDQQSKRAGKPGANKYAMLAR